jgi:uncharacterized LabA/DUF88 family protein
VKVSVYVDGFNLYHRAVKKPRAPTGGTYKWLDLHLLATNILNEPTSSIVSIRYFTARVLKLPRDPDAPARQAQYLRALRTISCLKLHYGQFRQRESWLQPCAPLQATNPQPNFKIRADGTQAVKVRKYDEKGSDVNLASYLLLDGFRGAYDLAAVITNDSDLVEPIRLVRDELGKPVHVYDPCRDRPSTELQSVATKYEKILITTIAASQFHNPLTDARGSFGKPPSW